MSALSSPRKGKPERPVAALAVGASGAAMLCGVSRAQWWKLHAMAKTPAPVYLGSKCPRWIRVELEQWLAAGCPDRTAWSRMRPGSTR
jgi:predicted DNA-binding transcriptional regulator AlpA